MAPRVSHCTSAHKRAHPPQARRLARLQRRPEWPQKRPQGACALRGRSPANWRCRQTSGSTCAPKLPKQGQGQGLTRGRYCERSAGRRLERPCAHTQMSDSSDTILRHATDSESARDVAAAHAAIVHASRRDSTATETRHEPSAVTAEARHEAATETRHGVLGAARLRAAATADSASYSHQLDMKPRRSSVGPRGQYGGVGWYQVLSKHGALVRSAATLDSELVCGGQGGQQTPRVFEYPRSTAPLYP